MQKKLDFLIKNIVEDATWERTVTVSKRKPDRARRLKDEPKDMSWKSNVKMNEELRQNRKKRSGRSNGLALCEKPWKEAIRNLRKEVASTLDSIAADIKIVKGNCLNF